MEYRVTWTIDLTADRPEDAADQALAIHRDPQSLATVFTVTDAEGRSVVVGKTQIAGPARPPEALSVPRAAQDEGSVPADGPRTRSDAGDALVLRRRVADRLASVLGEGAVPTVIRTRGGPLASSAVPAWLRSATMSGVDPGE